MLTFVDIELRQTQCRESRHQQRDTSPPTEDRFEVAEQDHRRCETERDIICQGVQFDTDRAGRFQQTGTQTVEEIKESTR